MWQENVEHLTEVFKQLEAADLKIKCSKCEVFKTKVHYLGFLVGINGVQPLPEKVAAIKALEPPKDINKLSQFHFYRKFIPFFADITACLNTMLRKRVTFQWMKQYNNMFELLKAGIGKNVSFTIS